MKPSPFGKHVAMHLVLVSITPLTAHAQDIQQHPPSQAQATLHLANHQDPFVPKTFTECALCPTIVSIPAGDFQMGNDLHRSGVPVHNVQVAQFGLATTEVTIGEFKAFVDATNHDTQSVCSGNSFHGVHGYFADRSYLNPWTVHDDTHPVSCVSYLDAIAYISWINGFVDGTPYRLPSEAEWEYVAFNDQEGKAFSWGGDVTLTCNYANVADQSYLEALRPIPDNAQEKAYREGQVQELRERSVKCDDGFAYTAPVGSFPQSGFGLFDMDGNVSEWVQDCFHPNYQSAPQTAIAWQSENQGDCSNRGHRGSDWSYFARSWPGAHFWGNNTELYPWVRNFSETDYTHAGIGFRLARDG